MWPNDRRPAILPALHATQTWLFKTARHAQAPENFQLVKLMVSMHSEYHDKSMSWMHLARASAEYRIA